MTPIRALFSLLLFLGCWMPSFATGPFPDEASIKAAFDDSVVIFKGTVVKRDVTWTCDGDRISREKLDKIVESFVKFQDEHISKFGVENYAEEAEAHRKKWNESELGILYQKDIEGIEIVTIKAAELRKGELNAGSKTVTVAWSLQLMPTCSHVTANRDVGKEVLVFLQKGWMKTSPVIPESLFQMGRPAMKPKEL